jgi:hypothetical protein
MRDQPAKSIFYIDHVCFPEGLLVPIVYPIGLRLPILGELRDHIDVLDLMGVNCCFRGKSPPIR